jgi:hypothetical protein
MEKFYLVSYESKTGRPKKEFQEKNNENACTLFQQIGFDTNNDHYVESAKKHNEEF